MSVDNEAKQREAGGFSTGLEYDEHSEFGQDSAANVPAPRVKGYSVWCSWMPALQVTLSPAESTCVPTTQSVKKLPSAPPSSITETLLSFLLSNKQ